MNALPFTFRIPEPDPVLDAEIASAGPHQPPDRRSPVLPASVGSRTSEANRLWRSSWPFQLTDPPS